MKSTMIHSFKPELTLIEDMPRLQETDGFEMPR